MGDEQAPTRDLTGGQFPSLDGDQAGEVAQRQPADNGEGFFHKIFTVHNRAHTPDLPHEHWWHRQNAVEVVSDAIRRGLHPKGEVEVVGESAHPSDPDTTNVEYRVPVVPAIVDHDQTTTVTPGATAADQGGPDEDADEQEDPDAPPLASAAAPALLS